MVLTLKRLSFTDQGVFGMLFDESAAQIAVSLEHSYYRQPKVPVGTYNCMRGQHQLDHGPKFETFEICGVPGHTDILFHCGNRQDDSKGCILLGTEIAGDVITESRAAFDRFIALTAGIDCFQLVVK